MNVLAIDAGNSRIKWGLADDHGWTRRAFLDTVDAVNLAGQLEGSTAPARIVISNVAGEAVRAALSTALTQHSVAPLWVQGREQQCGVRSGYANPAQLGADRWAGVIAAWSLYSCACVVINAGTTMTVDALSADGVFLGGVIVPGLDLMRNSLSAGTAQLKLQQGAFYYFPDNTGDAIYSGALNALAGTIDRMSAYMEESGQGTPLVVISGGAAALIKPRLNVRTELVDNLVLEGLLIIAKEEA